MTLGEDQDMDESEQPTILVPVDVSDPSTPSQALVTLVGPLHVVLLGYYQVPDQSAPEQLREEYEDEASANLEGVAESFETEGAEVDAVIVFTRDRQTSIDRIASEYECDAVFVPGTIEQVGRVLVPLRGDPNLERIVMFVGRLIRGSDIEVTLYHAVTPGEDPTESEFILRGAADRMSEESIDRDRITWEQSETESPVSEIVSLAEEHDVVVIGETEPSLRERILGDVPTRIIDQTGRPVFVIRAL